MFDDVLAIYFEFLFLIGWLAVGLLLFGRLLAFIDNALLKKQRREQAEYFRRIDERRGGL